MMRLAGSLVVSFPLFLNSIATAAPIFSDPQGDTFGENRALHDISSLDAEVDAQSILFRISFFDPVSPPSSLAVDSVIGFIDIDLDQNALTGATSKKSEFSPGGSSGLGTEYFINLSTERFTPGIAQVINAVTNLPVGSAALNFGERAVEVMVPRALFGGDIVLNYGVVVGGFIDISDEAPNFGQGVASTIPEPTASTVALTVIGACLNFRRKAWRAT